MEELLPFAIGAAVVALLAPARRRVVPVAKAAGRAGIGIAAATIAATTDIAGALIRGDAKQAEQSAPAA